MKKRILLFSILALLFFPGKLLAQCRGAGDWSGFSPFQSYFATANSIELHWAADGNYSWESYRILKKKWLSDPWVVVASGIKNSGIKVTGLESSTTYHFLIERYCDGDYVDNISSPSITTKDASYVPPNIDYCFGYWYGYTSNQAGLNYIKVFWSYDNTPGHDDKATFYVNYRMNDKDAGTSDWSVSTVTGKDYFLLTGLEEETNYEFLIRKYCNNSYVGSTSVILTTTPTIGGSQTILGPIITGVTSIGQTSATVGLQNYPFFYPGTRIDGFEAYVLKKGTSYWTYADFVPATTRETKQYYIGMSGLTPGAEYYVVIAQKYTLNPGQSYESHHAVFSRSFLFKTKPWGPCNSLTGNFTVPWENVGVNHITDREWRYSGTIFCTSNVILEAAVKVKFTATAIVLNPGFITNIGPGAFIADAFDPANCATIGNRTGNPTEPDSLKQIVQPTEKVTELHAQQQGVLSNILYPNPTTGSVTIRLSDNSEIIKNIFFTDVSGRVVYRNKTNSRTIDISKLINGIYFYTIETTKSNYTGKLIKL